MENFTLTESAAKRIKEINTQNHKNERLRIAVQGGGCSGFQYTFLMDEEVLAGDFVIEAHGASIIIDDVSLSFLDGSILDYQDDLSASMFTITNPNAKTGCGCGNSFSV